MHRISSVDAVVEALGGNTAVGRAFHTSSQAVSNWRAKNKLPSNTYVAMVHQLGRLRLRAPVELWSMRPWNGAKSGSSLNSQR